MEKHSETINAITKFLFICKEEPDLKTYELAIFLGNEDIEGNFVHRQSIYESPRQDVRIRLRVSRRSN